MSRRRSAWTRLVPVLALPLAAAARGAAPAPAPAATPRRLHERTVLDSVYTVAQAERGQAAYAQTCARCHAATLEGADVAPALAGGAFVSAWSGQSLDVLHERIQSAMPTDTPGVYGKALVTDVIAYMLKFNGYPAGGGELTHEQGALRAITLVPKP